MSRVGLVGRFHEQDYGDLLLPYLAEHELGRRLPGWTFRRYAVSRTDRATWPFEVGSADDLMDELDTLDGLVVSGGHLTAAEPGGMWLAPVLAAASAGLPVAWTVPAASSGIPDSLRPWLRAALEASAYVSAHDGAWGEVLSDIAPQVRVHLTPDPTFGLRPAVEQLVTEADLDELLSRLGVARPFVVVQASPGMAAAGVPLATSLSRLAAAGYDLLALPVAPARGDRCGLLRDDLGLICVQPWPSPPLLAALVARAEAVLADSAHLSITALAAGVPVHRPPAPPGGDGPLVSALPGVRPLAADGPDVTGDTRRPRQEHDAVRAARHELTRHWDGIAAAVGAAAGSGRAAPVRRLLLTAPGGLERLNGARALQVQVDHEEMRETRERLRRAERELSRLRNQPAVRLALAADARLRAAVEALRTLPRAASELTSRAPSPERSPRRADVRQEAALAAELRAELPPGTLSDGPEVSIVVLDRSGGRPLGPCLRGLASTSYAGVEVIVVPGGSPGDPPASLEGLATRFPVRVLRDAEGGSPAARANRGVAAARGELVLLLDDDVEPIAPGWLGHLVQTLQTHEAAAVGARLVSRRGPRGRGNPGGLSLQHRGMDFSFREGVPRARSLGAGTDPRATAAGAVREVPMASGACLLVRRDVYEAVGGLEEAYEDGTEDVDLCLKLRRHGGRVMYDGRAALWRRLPPVPAADQRRARAARAGRDHQRFLDRWGPQVYREALLDRLTGAGRWSEDPIHLAVAVNRQDPDAESGDPLTARKLGEELTRLGWRVSYLERQRDRWYSLPEDVDVLLSLADAYDLTRAPAHVIRVAWVRGGTERWLSRPWFDDHDLVLARDSRAKDLIEQRSAKVAHLGAGATAQVGARRLRDLLLGWVRADRVDLAVGVPRRREVERWGDYHYARATQRALERRGHPTRVSIASDWHRPTLARSDMVLHLSGVSEPRTRPSQVSVLWLISHPDRLTRERCAAHDLVLVASARFADAVRAWGVGQVGVLHQATDPDRFRPDPTGPAHELLFVGNSRRVRRRILADLLPTSHDLAVYGRNWTSDLLDPRFVRGTHIPNQELARYYASAAVVLNDHWDDMRAEGFLSNRLYDALAAGAFVLSDDVDGIAEEFDGGVVTYRTRDELAGLVERFLADPGARREHARRGREAVLARHTFAHRIAELLDCVAPHLEGRERFVQARARVERAEALAPAAT